MVTELRVLVVEDDIDLRTMITKDLQGYPVKLNHQNADFAFSV
jgi:CheY-like chemotaxis protein